MWPNEEMNDGPRRPEWDAVTSRPVPFHPRSRIPEADRGRGGLGPNCRELAAELASEGLDVRRLARYLRHHPSLTREELAGRMRGRLAAERLERAIDRLRRLGCLNLQGDQVLIR